MLWLKRNRRFNELMKCDVSNEYIYPGDYYYQDDTDNLIIKATVYKELKDKEKEKNWDYSKINNAQSEADYRKKLNDYTRELLGATVLQRKVAGKYDPNPEVETTDINSIYKDNVVGELNDNRH